VGTAANDLNGEGKPPIGGELKRERGIFWLGPLGPMNSNSYPSGSRTLNSHVHLYPHRDLLKHFAPAPITPSKNPAEKPPIFQPNPFYGLTPPE
jgi:hypothetical protein